MSSNIVKFKVTPTLDTAAYASGDLLFNPVDLGQIMSGFGGVAKLKRLHLVDKAGQSGAMDLLFFNVAPANGTLNAAVAITDSEADASTLAVSFVATDWVSYGGGSMTSAQLDITVRAASSAKNLYLVGVSKDTKTYGASDLVISGEFEG